MEVVGQSWNIFDPVSLAVSCGLRHCRDGEVYEVAGRQCARKLKTTQFRFQMVDVPNAFTEVYCKFQWSVDDLWYILSAGSYPRSSHAVSKNPRLKLRVAGQSDGACVFQQRRQATLLGLQVRVSANVFLSDEDIRHGRLAGQIGEGGLDSTSIVW